MRREQIRRPLRRAYPTPAERELVIQRRDDLLVDGPGE